MSILFKPIPFDGDVPLIRMEIKGKSLVRNYSSNWKKKLIFWFWNMIPFICLLLTILFSPKLKTGQNAMKNKEKRDWIRNGKPEIH